jgi:three-Cys-motif partner protein
MADEPIVRDRSRGLKLDEIGWWSQVKLDIVKDYASEYTKILSRQSLIRGFAYIDAFAGAGMHIEKTTGEFVLGSPLNALQVKPPFSEYFYIDLDTAKVGELRAATKDLSNVHVFEGDCNEILLDHVFPKVLYSDYRRGLCLLDPYGLHLDWKVIEAAGKMRSIELFLNFPVMDMNRNVLWRNPDEVDPAQAARMTRYWGDESWREVVYEPDPDLFNADKMGKVANANEQVALAFRERLQKVAGFASVPMPVAMKNSRGPTLYYLFFASNKPVAEKIVHHIFRTHAADGIAY